MAKTTATATPKRLYINEMHKVFEEARKTGNRGAIKEELALANGVTKGFFDAYLNTIGDLYKATAEYVHLKNGYEADEKQLKAAVSAIYKEWRSLLDCAEESAYERKMRLRPDDVSNLVGFAQKFVNDANNTTGVEGFAAQKQWATQTLARFRQSVEIEIGIRLAEVSVMSDERREYLDKERKCLATIRKSGKALEDLAKEKEHWDKMLAKVGEGLREEFDAAIKEIDSKIAHFTKKRTTAEAALEELHKAPVLA